MRIGDGTDETARWFDATGVKVKDAGRQTQDGVQMAFVHQVATNIGTLAASNSTLSGTTTAARAAGVGFQ